VKPKPWVRPSESWPPWVDGNLPVESDARAAAICPLVAMIVPEGSQRGGPPEANPVRSVQPDRPWHPPNQTILTRGLAASPPQTRRYAHWRTAGAGCPGRALCVSSTGATDQVHGAVHATLVRVAEFVSGVATTGAMIKPAFGERAYACAGAQDC